VEAEATRAATVAGLIEEGVGGGGVIRMLIDVGGEGPVLRREQAVGDARLA